MVIVKFDENTGTNEVKQIQDTTSDQPEHIESTATPAVEARRPSCGSSQLDIAAANLDEIKEKPTDVACGWHQQCQPECCQCFARPSCLLLWLCLCSFTQGMVISGFVKSVVTPIELRYELTSKESGFIVSMYDIGCLVCVVPVSYFGHGHRRSRLISIGLLVMGLGSFVFFLPHLITDKYIYQSPVPSVCYPEPNKVYPKFCNSQNLNSYKYVFWTGQFLHGVGASPLYTLGVAYLDDNLSMEDSGTFLGIYYAMSIIGPAVGFLLNARLLNVYVEPSATPSDIGPNNSSLWVGAWWIGFLLSALASVAIAGPMFGFPKSFQGSARIRLKRKRVPEAHRLDDLVKDAPSAINGSSMGFFQSLMVLLKNPTMLFLSFAGAVQLLLLASLSTFGPKILRTLFEFSTSRATLVMGLVTVFAGVIGMLAGGLLIRFSNLPLGRLLWFCVASAAISSLFALGLLLKCRGQRFAGINQHYPMSADQQRLYKLTVDCNKNCSCQENKFMYNPVCGADKIVYYSPCFAGCQDNSTVIDGVHYFSNCSCITAQTSDGFAARQDSAGFCLEGKCAKTSVIIVMLFLLTTCIFSLSVPTLQCTMRVVPAELKDLGLGLQWVIVRLFGSIPGPPLLGQLFDSTCSLWISGCDKTGSCSFYNSQKFWLTVLLFTLVLKLIEVAFLALAAVTYVPPYRAARK
ncbi:hypothetical protein BOX15_Mlig033592g3 [Macrostomum lignano]|uniref:Solute carrier organic anion transporter family member n=1 Tax=Macrostomum lignano TaxID=282301 RepID=A0A267FLH2_9PLAT|nr:hypothetical protein BOX15_Mlig033592g3 [Macrostomum lignano]